MVKVTWNIEMKPFRTERARLISLRIRHRNNKKSIWIEQLRYLRQCSARITQVFEAMPQGDAVDRRAPQVVQRVPDVEPRTTRSFNVHFSSNDTPTPLLGC